MTKLNLSRIHIKKLKQYIKGKEYSNFSVQPPDAYSARFIKFLNKCIKDKIDCLVNA